MTGFCGACGVSVTNLDEFECHSVLHRYDKWPMCRRHRRRDCLCPSQPYGVYDVRENDLGGTPAS